MADMKCPVCGGKDFIPYVFADGIHGEYTNYVDSYACLNCGRVEFYAKQSILDQRLAQMKKEKDAAAEVARYNEQIEAKKQELADLKAIIADENQTVKAVKEAQEKVHQVENEIRSLESAKANAARAGRRFPFM